MESRGSKEGEDWYKRFDYKEFGLISPLVQQKDFLQEVMWSGPDDEVKFSKSIRFNLLRR